MKIKRQLEATIDIEDPISACADGYVFNRLKRIFENKCFSGCLIKKILSVDEKSYCGMNSMRNRSLGSMSVKFTAMVFTLNVGEIIHGCKVVKVNQQKILCKYKELAITARQEGLLSVAAVDQLVSVVVESAFYQLGESSVYVGAGPLKLADENCYQVALCDVSASPAVIEAKARLEKAIGKAEQTKKSHKKAWDIFEKLFYPFKTEKPASGKNLADITTLGSSIVSYRVQPKSQPIYVEIVETADSAKPANIITALTAEQAAVAMIIEHIERLRLIRRSCELYNTRELLAQHQKIFAAIKLAKVD